MTGRYKCDVCGWSGDMPALSDYYGGEDDLIQVCPRGCKDPAGDGPAPVFLNPLHPAVARMMLRAMSASYKGGVGG